MQSYKKKTDSRINLPHFLLLDNKIFMNLCRIVDMTVSYSLGINTFL